MTHEPEVVDLSALGLAGNGVQWTLGEPSDLNVNLVSLDPDGLVGEHDNSDVDVLLVVLAGDGQLLVDAQPSVLTPRVLAHVPKATRRSIRAGQSGLVYLSVHRRRGPLSIRPGPH